jgi:hypothetical protein
MGVMDDLLRFSEAAFRRAAERTVADLFAANRSNPDARRGQIPIIGWMHGFFDFDPHGSPEEHAQLEALVVKALIAREWFKTQLPPCMQPLPLPLNEKERSILLNTGDRRLWTVAEYGMTLQSMHWDLSRAPMFIDYYAKSMSV